MLSACVGDTGHEYTLEGMQDTMRTHLVLIQSKQITTNRYVFGPERTPTTCTHMSSKM